MARLTYLALGLLVAVAVYALEFWGTTLRFEFGLPSRPFTLSARALDTGVTILETTGGYDIQISWSNPYYKDYVEINLSLTATVNVTLVFDIYEVTGLGGAGKYFLAATSYCFIRVPGYVYSPNGCSSIEVKLLGSDQPTTVSYTVEGYSGSYLVIRVRINNWGSGTGTLKLRVSASV
jgi:hypothetical protein